MSPENFDWPHFRPVQTNYVEYRPIQRSQVLLWCSETGVRTRPGINEPIIKTAVEIGFFVERFRFLINFSIVLVCWSIIELVEISCSWVLAMVVWLF